MKTRYEEIYNIYTKHLLEKGKPPTYAFIGKELNITREGVRFFLVEMEKAGYVMRLKKSSIFWCFSIEKFSKKEMPEMFEGTMDALNNLTIRQTLDK